MGILSEELKMFMDKNKLELSEANTLKHTLLNAAIAMEQGVIDSKNALKTGDVKGGYKAFGDILDDLSTAMYNAGRKSLSTEIDRVKDKMLKMEESKDFEDMMR